jgi:hypothetical protein
VHRFIDFVRSVENRFVSETVVRLVIAAILGGVIGLERELKRKPAGLRTNMFICFGSAMFTLMSYRHEDEHKETQSVHVGRTDHQYRVLFKVEATRNEHDNLMKRFRQSPAFSGVASLGEPEKE